MESTPQSTINHNAVIELASDLLRCPPRHRCNRGGRSKSRPPCPKGGLKSAGTMPKSYPRRNAVGRKNRRFRKVFAPKVAISTKILEMAKGRTRQRQFRTLCVQKLRGGLARNNGPDPVDGDPRNIGGLNERFEDVRGNRAQDFVIITAGPDISHGDG